VKNGAARRYTPDGSEHRPQGVDTILLGDMHEEGMDEQIWDITCKGKTSICSILKPRHVVTGDTFDNKWGNSHRVKQPIRSAYLAGHGYNNIRTALMQVSDRLHQLRSLLEPGTGITHIPSNHSDDWLRRLVNEADLSNDPLNARLTAELWMLVYDELEREGRTMEDKDAVEEKSPFGLFMQQYHPDINFPSYQDVVLRPLMGAEVIRQVLFLHGHNGPSGKETRSMKALAPYNKKTGTGHNHSATRYNGHDRAGVMTKRLKHYVTGPKTNWTNSHVVYFEDGSCVHVIIMHGRWHAQTVANDNVPLQKQKKAA
jgi:hypothetical protein